MWGGGGGQRKIYELGRPRAQCSFSYARDLGALLAKKEEEEAKFLSIIRNSALPVV